MRERSELVLADLIQLRAERMPDLEVLTFEGGSAGADQVRSFGDLQGNANRIAAGLIAKGLAPGDRLAVMMRNHPEFVETMIACSVVGALFVPIDPRTRGEKLAYMLRNAGCGGALCADDCLPALDAVRRQVPDLAWVRVVETGASADSSAGFEGVESVSEWLAEPAATVDVRADGPGAPLQIMYTSGTTGDPKGIVGENARFCSAGLLGNLFGYGPEDRPYTGLSLTHGNAQSVTLAPALVMGLRAVFSRRFSKSKLWEICRRYGCTTFSLVGGMATAIYSEPSRRDDADNPVRLV
ncbi:AMP-binding protein, partial [bacterium]|nr:AMP-binding protein [bacterium]